MLTQFLGQLIALTPSLGGVWVFVLKRKEEAKQKERGAL